MRRVICVVGCLTLLFLSARFWPATAQSDLLIYDDSASWDNWSWNSVVHLANTTPVQSGAQSIAITYTQAWAGFSLRTTPVINTSSYNAVSFWAHGGNSGARPLLFYTQASDGGGVSAGIPFTPSVGVWTSYTLTLAALGNPSVIARITVQDNSGAPQPVFYLDNIRLVGITSSPTPTPIVAVGAPVTLTVNVAANRKPISPYIYGMHYASEAFANEIALPVRRWGGNDTTRYNWTLNAFGNGSDYFFENNPKGMSADQFIARDRRTNTKTIMTMPLSGWIAKDSNACGFSVMKYGAQKLVDPFRTDCGNGIRPDDSLVSGNDPADTSIPITTAFVVNWLQHLTQTGGTAANGGVLFYNLDNEPDIWFETHRDVFPTGWKYDEFRERTYSYAAAIKATEPTAKTLGPVVNGWTYYFHSPYDGQRQDWITPDDRNAHGGAPFVEWYLRQMRAYEQITGTRILDYFDLHYYPQATGVALSGAGDANRQALRLRSTRSLWDPTYVDESWIETAGPDNGIVRLIPRMRDWVSANYPGTQLAIGEYNWGALDHINGALAQAEALGIFGREGVDLATFFDTPFGGGLFSPSSPGAYAFRMYRNYDGAGGQFGDVSVSATSSDADRLSIYAAQRSGDASLTLLVINKAMTTTITATVNLASFTPAASAQLYRYSDANLNAIVSLPNQSITNNSFMTSFPANSITLARIAPGQVLNHKVFVPLTIR